MQDGQQVTTMEAKNVYCFAVSNNGKWIAGGPSTVFVGDVETHQIVWTQWEGSKDMSAVDFSPDSTKLVSGSSDCTAIIWDVTSGGTVRRLRHESPVIAAKYSPDGD